MFSVQDFVVQALKNITTKFEQQRSRGSAWQGARSSGPPGLSSAGVNSRFIVLLHRGALERDQGRLERAWHD